MIVVNESHQGAIDMPVTTIGLDIAKNVFQVHAIDSDEKVVVRKTCKGLNLLCIDENIAVAASGISLAPCLCSPSPTI